MKNIISVDRDDACIRYRETQMEYLNDCQDDVAVPEFSADLMQLSEELSGLSSQELETSRRMFRKLFSSGATMMLLNSEDFHILEKFESNGVTDWCVIIFTSCGQPIGKFTRDDVTW